MSSTTTGRMSNKTRLTLTDIDTNLSRFNSFRSSNQRTRTSIVPQYSIDINTTTQQDEFQNSRIDEEDQNDTLMCYLVRPQWNVCRVSPLHNLEYTPTKLKQYAQKLKQHLPPNASGNFEVKYNVDIKVIENLKLEVEHDNALQIKVTECNGTRNENSKSVYECILFSWSHSSIQRNQNTINLPLLLDNGRMKIAASIRQYLMKLFDCVITPLSFTQSELLFFGALLSSFPPIDGSKLVKFLYNVPATKEPTTFDITITANDMHDMWLSCFPDGKPSSVLREQNSRILFSAFQRFIHYVYELDVARLELTSLNFPSVLIQNKGKLQLRDVNAARAILKILCEMSVILKGPVPKLASDYDG